MTGDSEVRLERFDGILRERLAVSDFANIRDLVNGSAFRAALLVQERQCSSVFDATVILTFVTDEGTIRDSRVGGCIFGDTERVHPYKQLYTLIRASWERYFPGAVILP